MTEFPLIYGMRNTIGPIPDVAVAMELIVKFCVTENKENALPVRKVNQRKFEVLKRCKADKLFDII